MFRSLEGKEIDAMYQSAVLAMETFRDDRNTMLTLAPQVECDDGIEALSCPVRGLNAINDLGKMNRDLQRQFPGCKLGVEMLPGEKSRYTLTLPKYVKDTRPLSSADDGDGPRGVGGPIKPSTDRAMLLVVLLVILSAMLWARL